jgi:hypothetical protein
MKVLLQVVVLVSLGVEMTMGTQVVVDFLVAREAEALKLLLMALDIVAGHLRMLIGLVVIRVLDLGIEPIILPLGMEEVQVIMAPAHQDML